MMGIDPGRRSPGSIYNKLVRSREDWKQQVAIPSTAGVRTLLLLNSRARSFSPAPSSSSTGRKLAAEKESNTQTKETMSVSYKVKKIGKARTPLAVDGYIALMACNGKAIFTFICPFPIFLFFFIALSLLSVVIYVLQHRS
jgi:hypothetical protein